MVMTTLSIVLNVVVLNYHHRPNNAEVTRGCMAVVRRIATIVCHTLRFKDQRPNLQDGKSTAAENSRHQTTSDTGVLLENGGLRHPHKTYVATSSKDRLVNHCRMRQSFQVGTSPILSNLIFIVI